MTASAGPGFSLTENAADCDALLHGWQPAENPLCALQREAALCLPAKLPIKWHLQSRSEGKRGAEISLISRLVRCVSLWALLIMSNQSKVPTWKNWLLQKRKRKKQLSTVCVTFSSPNSSRRQRGAAPLGLAGVCHLPFGMNFNSLL